MPKIAVKAPQKDVQEPPSRRKIRHKSGSAPVRYPADVAFWTIKNSRGEKLRAEVEDGVIAEKFPIVDFTTAEVRERWGDGAYVVNFFAQSGASKGFQRFQLGAAPMPPPEVEPTRAIVVDDPFERQLKLLGAINGMAESKAASIVGLQMDFMKSSQATSLNMFEAFMGRAREIDRQQAAVPSGLQQALEAIATELKTLRRDVDELYDPDPDDPENAAGSPGEQPIAFPEDWDGFGQFAYRVLVRNLPKLEPVAAQLAANMVETFKKAAEQRAAAVAVKAGAA